MMDNFGTNPPPANGSVFCKNCGQPVKAGSRFCRNCGADLAPQAVQPPQAPDNPPPANGSVFCKNCGQPVKAGSRFCRNCGADRTPATVQPESAAAEQPARTPDVSPPPAHGNTGTAAVPVRRSGNKLPAGILAGVGAVAVVVVAGLYFFNAKIKLSSLAEQEREKWMTDLYEHLDRRFVSDLQLNEKLAFFLFENRGDVSDKALEKWRKETVNRTGGEIAEIAEKWATDNRIDFKDLMNRAGSGDGKLISGYVSHLEELAEVQLWEMKAISRRGTLAGDLYFFLDEHFTSVLQTDGQLMNLLLSGNTEALKSRITGEMRPVIRKWVAERQDVAVEDWKPEDLIAEYMPRLVEKAGELAVETAEYAATAKAFFHNGPDAGTARKAYLAEGDIVRISQVQNGFGYTVFTNSTGQVTQGWIKMNELRAVQTGSLPAWLAGDWVPDREGDYAERDLVTFEKEGRFSFGDDCITSGTCTVRENTVYLHGKTACDAEDSEESDYNGTMTISGNTLEGYKKLLQ
ncbi:MAG: zinc ribbon domain-containing protein [Tannerella sp.]|jgi:RNA polymerase subunit RPABC4/transcription elongation factor Spt4|nr:zinc ribbon domain-containing protein [Tannerella sp.]